MSLVDYSRIAHQLGRLVAVPSVSSHDPRLDCSNRGVAELIATWLEDVGFRVEWVPVQRGVDKVDLVATLGYGEPGLVLSGHTDTVPCDEHGWDTDPFRLTERDGRLFGLGAADMKAFFPLVLESLQGLNPTGCAVRWSCAPPPMRKARWPASRRCSRRSTCTGPGR